MTKMNIKSFQNLWTDCIHCKKILKAIEEEAYGMLDSNIIRHHDVEFPIGHILNRCINMKMSNKTFQKHLKYHLLWMKAVEKVGRYKISLGKNFSLYTRTTTAISVIKLIRPKNFESFVRTDYDLQFSDIDEIVKSIYFPIIEHGDKTVKISNKKKKKKVD